MKKLLILFVALAAVTFRVEAREKINFDKGWRFILADSAQMSLAMYDDSAWRMLNVPHDWAIEGDFSASAPSGNSGGALPGGVGWYRKSFEVAAADKGKLFYIDFDGVYMNAKVWINGQLLGQRPYGYSSFRFDLTPHLKFGARNVVAVRVDNSDQPNSRWYSGCGIYRHVWLVKTEKIHVAHWGTHVVAEGNKVSVSVSIDNNTTSQQTVVVRNKIISPAGVQVASASKKLSLNPSAKSISSLSQLKVSRPQIWSCETPYIYKVVTTIEQNGKVVDTYETPTGFRTFKFDAEKGFSLNGKSMKINGVCQHHDLGCLGAAVNEDALYRQLRILKEMGTNAVRCSHNPPAPELLAMCDTMGLIVMDESFDMWRRRKTKNDYARFFDQWAERDLTDLVLRDRNHPSILMWSIGNEVLEQWSSADADTLSAEQANLILNAGHDASTLSHGTEMSVNSLLCKNLCEIIRRLDNTRPITAGCNEPDPKNHLFKSGALDIIGFNYHHQWVKDVPKNFPGKPFIFSESVSALQTRGFYMMPSDSVYKAPIEWWLPYQDPSFQCSAYDNMHASWSSTHEETWDVVKHNDFVGGQFIWTGFDYIGEPTPYGFPARSSYFGIVDLAGFPKDSYYMYQSEWTDKQVLHLFPHWNWLEGQDIDLWCYYNNADEVELFINGRSQGVKAKKDDHEYHLMWRVKFEPGEVKAVARKNGKVVAEKTIRTSGAPAQLRMTSDRIRFGNNSNGDNLAFITVEVIDKDGNLCPRADDQVFFEVEGGRIVGVDNGNPISMERFKDTKRKAFNGKCLVVVATDGGDVTVRAKGYQLGGSEVMVKKSM
ncbi:MAG: glycoside hydrolase family 2 TIM barrel-domain containing protein [Prevotellaceae bacterium]|nr:glycoside hydrolase family 2 TIM barrel-domain containing protein [Prevotellaceae bacterium]